MSGSLASLVLFCLLAVCPLAGAEGIWSAPVAIYAQPIAPTTDDSTRVLDRNWPLALRQPKRDQYQLNVVLDYSQRKLAIDQRTTYTNRQHQDLIDILFVVEPNRHPGAFTLNEITYGDDQRPVVDWTLDGSRLAIELDGPLLPDATIQLNMRYDLTLPQQRGYFGYTTRQMNLGDWYPYVAPQGADGTWLIHEPGAVGEHQVYPIADYEVTIVGDELESLQIAASAAGIKTEQGLKFRLKNARNFAWSASPEYEKGLRLVDGVAITAYWFPEHATAGEESLNATAQALHLYNERFAPYPHPSLTSVEADFADGMEFDGMYFLGKEYYAGYSGSAASYLTMLSAHETAHQWWYGLVANDQALEPFLDEAFATYSEILFYEQYYPELVEWWWGYRIRRFAPTGCVNSTIYDHSGFRGYVNAVYLRGAMLLEDLRMEMGEDHFNAFLHTYVQSHRRGIVSLTDFYEHLQSILGKSRLPVLQPYCMP